MEAFGRRPPEYVAPPSAAGIRNPSQLQTPNDVRDDGSFPRQRSPRRHARHICARVSGIILLSLAGRRNALSPAARNMPAGATYGMSWPGQLLAASSCRIGGRRDHSGDGCSPVTGRQVGRPWRVIWDNGNCVVWWWCPTMGWSALGGVGSSGRIGNCSGRAQSPPSPASSITRLPRSAGISAASQSA
jgi:hypothetical protein